MCFGVGKSGAPDVKKLAFGELPSLLSIGQKREVDYQDRPEPSLTAYSPESASRKPRQY